MAWIVKFKKKERERGILITVKATLSSTNGLFSLAEKGNKYMEGETR